MGIKHKLVMMISDDDPFIIGVLPHITVIAEPMQDCNDLTPMPLSKLNKRYLVMNVFGWNILFLN